MTDRVRIVALRIQF